MRSVCFTGDASLRSMKQMLANNRPSLPVNTATGRAVPFPTSSVFWLLANDAPRGSQREAAQVPDYPIARRQATAHTHRPGDLRCSNKYQTARNAPARDQWSGSGHCDTAPSPGANRATTGNASLRSRESIVRTSAAHCLPDRYRFQTDSNTHRSQGHRYCGSHARDRRSGSCDFGSYRTTPPTPVHGNVAGIWPT